MGKDEITYVTEGEIVGPQLTVEQADTIEHRAKDLYLSAERNYVRFSVEIRRLQEGSAHLARGFPNFGTYCEQVFDGLNANTAKQLSRQGQVLIQLQQAGRLNIDRDDTLPRSGGIRALAVVFSKHGLDTMCAVYDLALASGRGITQSSVESAIAQTLIANAKPTELGPGSDDLIDDSVNDEDEDDYDHDIYDKFDIIQRYLDDARDTFPREACLKIFDEHLMPELRLLRQELTSDRS